MKTSGIPNAGLGVWTLTDLPECVIIGPYEGEVIYQTWSTYTWEVSRARSHEQFFFGKDQLSQKLWQIIYVHTHQRKVLKKLCYRIFVNLSLFVSVGLVNGRGCFSQPTSLINASKPVETLSHIPRRYRENLLNVFGKDVGLHKQS